MKRIFFAFLILLPALSCFAKDKTKPDPADYTITIHVQSSRLVDLCYPLCAWVQHLTVLVDGKKYEITDTATSPDLMRVGDYKAKILKDETERPYEYQRTYEFLMSDDGKRRFVVVAESE